MSKARPTPSPRGLGASKISSPKATKVIETAIQANPPKQRREEHLVWAPSSHHNVQRVPQILPLGENWGVIAQPWHVPPLGEWGHLLPPQATLIPAYPTNLLQILAFYTTIFLNLSQNKIRRAILQKWALCSHQPTIQGSILQKTLYKKEYPTNNGLYTKTNILHIFILQIF